MIERLCSTALKFDKVILRHITGDHALMLRSFELIGAQEMPAIRHIYIGEALMREYRNAVADNARWTGFEPRSDDIFVCTPPKCGTTWMQTIVANLLWPDGDVPGQIVEGISPWIEAKFMPADAMHAMLKAAPLSLLIEFSPVSVMYRSFHNYKRSVGVPSGSAVTR